MTKKKAGRPKGTTNIKRSQKKFGNFAGTFIKLKNRKSRPTKKDIRKDIKNRTILLTREENYRHTKKIHKIKRDEKRIRKRFGV